MHLNTLIANLQDFSDESDDVDYQPPPPRHSSTTERQPAREEDGPSTTRGSQPSCKDGVEDKERRMLRHEHFGRMAERFGYSSRHEFALHVRDAGREERQRLLREFYGGTEVVEGKGKRRLTAAKAHPAKRVRKLPESVARKPSRRKIKPALEFEDSPPPPPLPPPLLQETSESHDTEEKFPDGMKSLEVHADADLTSPVPSRLPSVRADAALTSPVPSRLPSVRADASLTSPVPSRLQSATTSDYNNTHNKHVHEEQFSPSMFGTLTEVSPSGGRNCPTHCSSIDELFEEVGYHGNLEVATTLSNKVQTKNEKALPSINIDELFGL